MFRRRKSESRPRATEANVPVPALPTLSHVTLPDANDFRSSVILPNLAKRFSVLQNSDGSAVSYAQMQAHLRDQRTLGRLTEDEEQIVLHSIYGALPEDTLHEYYAARDAARGNSLFGAGSSERDYHTVARERAGSAHSSQSKSRRPSTVQSTRTDEYARKDSQISPKQLDRRSADCHHWDYEGPPSPHTVAQPAMHRSPPSPTSLGPSRNPSEGENIYFRTDRQDSDDTHESLIDMPVTANSHLFANPVRGSAFPRFPSFDDGAISPKTPTESTFTSILPLHLSPRTRQSSQSEDSIYEPNHENDTQSSAFDLDDTKDHNLDLAPDEAVSEQHLASLGISMSDVKAIQRQLVRKASQDLLAHAKSPSLEVRQSPADIESFAAPTRTPPPVPEPERPTTPPLDSVRHKRLMELHDALDASPVDPLMSTSVPTTPRVAAIQTTSRDSYNDSRSITPPRSGSPISALPRTASPKLRSKQGSRASSPRVASVISSPIQTRSPEEFSISTTPRAAPAAPQTFSRHTPSMLMEHVRQQSNEATAALKQPSSPNQGEKRGLLSKKKSFKLLRIGTPQLVSSSADLQNMPAVNLATFGFADSTPPNRMTPPLDSGDSSAGARFLDRIGKTMDTGTPSHPSMSPASTGNNSPAPSSSSPAISRSALSPAFNSSPDLSSRTASPQVASPTTPQTGLKGFMARLRRRKDTSSSSDTQSPPIIHHAPPQISLPVITNASTASNAKLLDSPGSPFGLGLVKREDEETAPLQINKSKDTTPSPDRPHEPSQMPSLDSLKRLVDIATTSGLDSPKVSEIFEARAREASAATEKEERNRIVRTTIIIPSAPLIDQLEAEDDVLQSETASPQTPLVAPSPRASPRRKKRTPSDASAPASPRSIAERSPTPPPGHRRRRSAQQQAAAESPLPKLPSPLNLQPPTFNSLASQHRQHLSRPPLGSTAPSFRSNHSTFDANSIYNMYDNGDEGEVVLAQGTIPSSENTGDFLAEISPNLLQHHADSKRTSYIQVNQMADNSLVWQVLSSMRAPSSADDPRFSFSHSRQSSTASSAIFTPSSKDSAPTFSSVDSVPSDPVKLVVRHPKKLGTHTMSHVRQSLVSERSAFEVIEANEAELDGLINELTQKHDRAQFDLARLSRYD